MKKILFAALAALAITSCSQNEIDGIDNGTPKSKNEKTIYELYEKLPAGNDSLPCKYGGSGTGLLSRRYGTIENKTT